MKSHAAERVDFHIEDMTIPISIEELDTWNRNFSFESSDELEEFKDYSELSVWLNMLGFKSREALSDFLNTPLVKDRSLARQLLRSWVGRRLLDEFSDLVVVDKDKSGRIILSTLETLLENQEQVSLLDLLRSLPADVIEFDANGWLKVFNNWRNELKKQQNLLVDLRAISVNSKSVHYKSKSDRTITPSFKELVKIKASHRNKDLVLELWRPTIRTSVRRNWIVFMPGLGGDPNHFSWLSSLLSQNGWDVAVIDHPGSNGEAMQSLIEGENPFPSGAELFQNRIFDLFTVLKAKEEGTFSMKGDGYIFMGHSLGALTAFLASGAIPEKGLDKRCNKFLNDFSVTNLSRLLQCQITDLIIDEEKNVNSLSAIVGINSFGKLLWPDSLDLELNVPFFLTGGTFDLVTPALSEQLGLLLSSKDNDFSRVLIIEGASHFSPIRIDDNFSEIDLYKISDSFVGVNPIEVQNLLGNQIVRFLENLESERSLPVSIDQYTNKLNFLLLDRATIYKLTGI